MTSASPGWTVAPTSTGDRDDPAGLARRRRGAPSSWTRARRGSGRACTSSPRPPRSRRRCPAAGRVTAVGSGSLGTRLVLAGRNAAVRTRFADRRDAGRRLAEPVAALGLDPTRWWSPCPAAACPSPPRSPACSTHRSTCWSSASSACPASPSSALGAVAEGGAEVVDHRLARDARRHAARRSTRCGPRPCTRSTRRVPTYRERRGRRPTRRRARGRARRRRPGHRADRRGGDRRAPHARRVDGSCWPCPSRRPTTADDLGARGRRGRHRAAPARHAGGGALVPRLHPDDRRRGRRRARRQRR